jgi:glycosyltransferase involved in cell wall biosynthesis
VNLAPLRFGAGIKGKLVQGMRCGTPAVSTVVGAEGIGDVKDFGGAIAESAGEFATAAVKLFQNRSDWRAAQLKGAVAMNQQFNRDKLETKLRARISELRQNLEAHRSKNFIGAMLLHHTLARTKYMAKWIEGKNNGSSV